jgi:eukaryotic-like serine/threonine-protein kinase
VFTFVPGGVMARIRGSAFITLREFVKERFGTAGWEKLLGRLSAEDRKEVDEILPIGWYDFRLRVRMLRILESELGVGDPKILEQFGRFGAERDLNTITRAFLKLASPSFALEKTGEYWSRFHDYGSWKVVRNSERAATGTLTDTPFDNELYCKELRGYMQRLLELVGAKDVKLIHTLCIGRGDKVCEFKGTWR